MASWLELGLICSLALQPCEYPHATSKCHQRKDQSVRTAAFASIKWVAEGYFQSRNRAWELIWAVPQMSAFWHACGRKKDADVQSIWRNMDSPGTDRQLELQESIPGLIITMFTFYSSSLTLCICTWFNDFVPLNSMNVREWKQENVFIVNRSEGEIISAISCQFFSWSSLFSQALASTEQEIWKQLHSYPGWIQALLSSNMLWQFQKAHPKYEVFIYRPGYCKLVSFCCSYFCKKKKKKK